MGRPKKERRKRKTGVTIDPDLYEWVQSEIKIKNFANLSHAINKALLVLKQKMEKKWLLIEKSFLKKGYVYNW